jgi:NAD(P)-dependent dehydrogenase (short-subunit alcohol dehydrogenase family)
MLFEGKVVVVSGAGPGLGQAMAVLAAQQGAKVAITARSPDKLAAIEAEIVRAAPGAQVLQIPTDIRDADRCQAAAARIVERFGRLDGLVNSGFVLGDLAPIETADFDDWRNTIETNFFGSLNMCRAAFPTMKAQGKGSIVNINTMASRKPMEGYGGYMASKSALSALTRLMAQEWGGFGIRVNTVTMGWMWGPSVAGFMAQVAESGGPTVEAQKAEVAAGIPLGAIPTDIDCAKAAIAMLSDQFSQVTGATLDSNGGEFMAL